MAYLYGRHFTKQELMKRIGDISQAAGVKQYNFTTGMAKGVHGIDVNAGGGLMFTILPDRGMDIAYAEYKGIPFGFISKTGIVAPGFFDPQGLGFLKSFYAGLLTTCGMTYMGAPCCDEGKELGLHGRMSHIIADDVAVSKQWAGDDYYISVKGTVRESTVFGENITLTREISCKLGESKINIKDTVENCGFDEQPLMLLYHCNFGYPIVSEDTVLLGLDGNVVPRDAEAEKGLDICHSYDAPVHGYREQCFFYNLAHNKEKQAQVCLFNKAMNIGAYVRFNKDQLPYFTQWKQIGEGDYVVGLEPGTYYPVGRAKARESGNLPHIQPGEIKTFELEIGITEGEAYDASK